jgi:enoyl-CoA hydratase
MSTETSALITTETRGRLLLIGLNRPAKRNGFTPDMAQQLADAYTRLEHDPDLWVGVLHAHGEHFTAGLDLPTWTQIMQDGGTMWRANSIDPLELREPRRSKPVVAAVQGITYTLGIELMLAADMVVAADNCRFSQLEVKRGIMATGGATLRMAERAGIGNAMWCLLTGAEFDAATALRMGFVQEVVPAGQQLHQALALAQQIAANAPLAVRAMRHSVLTAREQGHLIAAAQMDATQVRLAHTLDAAEGVRSFVERRPAKFQGR